MNNYRLVLPDILFAAPVLAPFAFHGDFSPVSFVEAGFLGICSVVLMRANKAATARSVRLSRESSDATRALNFVREFEGKGLGWFWETDRHGRLVYLSDSVVDRFDRPREDLIGQKFTSLVANDDGTDGGREGRTLGFHLSLRSPFNDLSLKALVDEERWWAVSGSPIVDDLGNFTGFRGSGTDLTEMKRSEHTVNQLARYDPLTGLSNRLDINQALTRALTGHNGRPQPCALFMVDLDKFKQVNDTLGHPAGDALLEQVAERLTESVGKTGLVGRLGGDEFQIVLPKLTLEAELDELATRIIARLSQPYQLAQGMVRIGASIGIAISHHEAVAASALVRNADLALYAAKDAGRGVCRFYEADMHTYANDRRELEDDLRSAVNKGELYLVYQPVVEVSTETISGFEALVRWDHPTRGPINPELLISIAEETNLIVRLGEWILRTACAQLAQWDGKLKMAVNVSPTQFAAENFMEVVINAIAANGIQPQQLELEITEGIFLDGSDENIRTFNRLKATGVRLALDDFGTGYSALGYLQKVPFDKIKIDQSFVRGATLKGNMNSAIIASIVSLADALEMDTTAEGAETHDELALVRSLGCSHVQGYIYGRPIDADAATALLDLRNGNIAADGFKTHREPRKTAFRRVGVVHDDYCYEGLVRNLTQRGAMIDGLADVPPGTEFVIEFSDQAQVMAVSRWSDGERMGVEFDRPINVEELRQRTASKVATGWRRRREAG
ncbi:MAG: EAL domain-containing protein [Sphingomonadales bacterium]|nr:EAL domain-containing protein [Sphingomonadales bacterium]